MPGQVLALILLPKTYNADANGVRIAVEEEKFMQTARELAQAFGDGAIIVLEPRASGIWRHAGREFLDDLAFAEVEIPDTSGNRSWLKKYVKETLLSRFEQIAIRVTFITGIEGDNITSESVT